jgi:hypothetical protein
VPRGTDPSVTDHHDRRWLILAVIGIVGGSLGTALLSTLAVSAATSFLTDHGRAPELLRRAAAEGYTTAFGWAAAIFALGALITGGLLLSRVRPVPSPAAPEPFPAHS